MITRDEMLAPMLEADPSFEATWQAFVAEYADEPELPLYIVLGELAEHFIDRLRGGDVADFNKVFAVVERWHVDGDAYVGEAATIGFLESLQNQLGGNVAAKRVDVISSSDFVRYLGPESRRWWDKLYRFWDGDTTALRFDT